MEEGEDGWTQGGAQDAGGETTVKYMLTLLRALQSLFQNVTKTFQLGFLDDETYMGSDFDLPRC